MERGVSTKFLIVVLTLVFFSSFVYADSHNIAGNDTSSDSSGVAAASTSGFNPTTSYNWLFQEVSNRTLDVDERAISTVALIQGSSGQLSGLIESLRDLEDVNQGCWPNGGCKVKDSALATLVLALSGQNITKEVQWLKSARVAGLSGGEWWIVIKASSNGTCQFAYPGGNRTFSIQDDRIRQQSGAFTSGQYYINLNELNSGLRTQPQPQITVGCDSNLLNPIITLIYKPGASTFFIQRSDAAANLQLRPANVCFGNQVPAGTCNYESTAYATWALLEIGAITGDQDLSLENIGTHIYLESQALNKRSDPVALGLLNRILIKSGSAAPSFISDLSALQRPVDGSWGGDVIATSIASFGLTGSDQGEAVARGINYLSDRVSDEGHWGNSIEATSWALIALHGGELSRVVLGGGSVPISNAEVCGNGIDDDLDGMSDCGEVECMDSELCKCQNNQQDTDEEGVDCGIACGVACLDEGEEQPEPEPEPEPTEPECETDEDCGESMTCDNAGFCVSLPPEEGSLWWIWLLIILVVLGGGGYFFYIKYIKTGKIDLKNLFRKKPKGPTFEEFRRQADFRPIQQQPQRPAGPARPMPPMRQAPVTKPKSKEDEELDRSIREAEKLLKGK